MGFIKSCPSCQRLSSVLKLLWKFLQTEVLYFIYLLVLLPLMFFVLLIIFNLVNLVLVLRILSFYLFLCTFYEKKTDQKRVYVFFFFGSPLLLN